VRYDAGVRSSSVAISDLDGDQVPDLAVANFGVDPDYDGGVSVLLGVGDGTFTGEVNYATGEASSSVAIGDLDGDQTPDLAVANYWDYNVSVLLGLGDGTFTTAAHFAAGYKPQCVVIADLDGDLALDLAVANTWTYPGNGSVSVLLNQDDCNANGIRDECDIDCGPPGAACDVPGCGMSEDCTDNGVPDECDIADGTSDDCNENGVPDECDIANGTSEDANDNGIPDECEPGLDIKPGSCPNPLNRKSHGVLPVALLGTADIEATTIDVSSILLARADGVGSEVAPHEGPPGPHSVFEDVGTPFYGEWCDCHDLEGDGFVDLLMKFETHEVVEALELNDLDPGALVELIVSGNLLDGTAFTASDCIRLVPPGTAAGQLYVESTAPSAWIDASPLDETLDGGGFADFERVYPLTTVVTLTAEISLHGQSFVAWQIDGEMQEPGENTVQFVMDESMTVKALYRAPVFWLPWQMETETPLPGTEAP
jgi:hypothetical protein